MRRWYFPWDNLTILALTLLLSLTITLGHC
jgi:hypothetical protein